MIVGAGPTGLCFALALAKLGRNVLIIDPLSNKKHDGRVLALSYASCDLLKQLNAWSPDATTELNAVEVSHSGFGVSRIYAQDINLAYLGFTVSYDDLCANLLKEAHNSQLIEVLKGEVIDVLDGESFATIKYLNLDNNNPCYMTAQSVILANGNNLKYQKKINYDYQQKALVVHLKSEFKHNNTAYERFTNFGSLVLLPFEDHLVLVWSMNKDLANELLEDTTKLKQLINGQLAKKFGPLELAGHPLSYPLKLIQAKYIEFKRIILVGNAAQTIHPVSAQGLNLSLREVLPIAKLIDLEIDSEKPALLASHLAKTRKKDVNSIILFTHFFAEFLDGNNRLFNFLRGPGIFILSNLPWLKKYITRSLIFGAKHNV